MRLLVYIAIGLVIAFIFAVLVLSLWNDSGKSRRGENGLPSHLSAVIFDNGSGTRPPQQSGC